MATSSTPSSNLRLYTEPSVRTPQPSGLGVGSLPDVLSAFRRVTGWTLQYAHGPVSKAAPTKTAESAWSAPINACRGETAGQFVLGRPEDELETAPQVPFEAARGLASGLAGMLEELLQTRRALQEREAELAAGVPLVPHPEEPKHLAQRLEAVLRGGAQAVGCHAAALYLLDEATSKLKLRSCWGLPLDRLTASPRPLKGAVADLESMLGHAVVLEDTRLMRSWNVPENFPAAACVPVSTPTTLLGTLWTFSNTKRDFTDEQTNILEVVAGRVASDLEREMLWQEGFAAAEIKKQIAAAERLQRGQLPSIAPILDGWDLAGWTAQGEALGGDFHDWFCLPDGLLAVAVGHAMDSGVPAALAANGLKAALRAHGQYYREAQQTLKRLNLTLWTGSAGDQYASLFYGLVETATGRICTASAGCPGVLIVRPDGWESLSQISAKLGEAPESLCEQTGYKLQPGEALVLCTEGALAVPTAGGKPLGEAGMGELLHKVFDRPAAEMVAAVRRQIELPTTHPKGVDRTVLVVKRRKS